MLKRFVRWLFGYLYITLKGQYPEHFINLCSNKGIRLWGLAFAKGECSCYIKLKDYKTLRPIAKKTKTVPYIKQRFGFPFFLRRVLRRKVYFIGILLFCMLLYILSRYIWDISIDGGYTHTPEQLLVYLNSTGVYSGCKIKDIDCPQIEENIRRDYPDIGWVSAQIKGTRLIVSIVETMNPELDVEKKTDLPYAHIRATKDGIIDEIITRAGTPSVGIGSVVKKGDIIISGIVPVIGDDGTVVDNKLVVAEGDIRMKTYVNYDAKFSMNYTYRDYTGKKKTGYQLDVWNKKIFYLSPSHSYEHYDIINDINILKLVRNFYLPIRITKSTVYEYTVENAVYTENEALEKANKELLRFLEELMRTGTTIVENQVQISIDKGLCRSQGKIIIEQPAWEYAEIEDSEWRVLESDEHNGDNN